MENKKNLSKTLTALLISLLIFSSIPQFTWAVGNEGLTEDRDVLIRLLEDILIEIDEEEIGQISEGTYLYAQEVDEKFIVQFGEKVIEFNSVNVSLIESDIYEIFVEENDIEYVGYVESDTTFELMSKNKELFGHITLKENLKYPVVNETEDTYEIIFGNRLFSIEKNDQLTYYSANESSNTKEISEKNGNDNLVLSNINNNLNNIEKLSEEEEDDSGQEKDEQEEEPALNNDYLNIKFGNYFEVINDFAVVYDNRSGTLVKVGMLKKGQTYPIVSDYGNWHRIWFGDHYGYVHKQNTITGNKSSIINLNQNYNNTNEKFMANKTTVVYDNTSGKLVPFAEIEKGKAFPIVSDYGNWYRVLVADRVGYVNKTGLNGIFSRNGKYFEVTVDNLAVYDNRSGSLKKIGELKKGQVYERVSDYGSWHRIQFGNIYGYVHKTGTIANFKSRVSNLNTSYKNSNLLFTTNKKAVVYDNTSGKLVPFATIEKDQTYPIASDYGNWYRIILSNKVGYIHKRDVNLLFTKEMRYFKVTTDNLPIYDNRTGSLVKVGTLKKGQVYERTSDYGNWHRIQFGDYYGYVRKLDTEVALTSTYSNRAKTKGSIGTLTPKREVQVYDNTSGQLVAYATIDKGKSYPIVRDYGNWYEVNLSGRYGYVRKSEVTANVILAKNIVNPKSVYTYENLVRDVNEFAKTYPGLISWKSIGKSVDGRNIYAIKLGKGKKEITINGAHHAREWLTTNLVMEMLDEYSQAYVKNQAFGGYNVRKILDEVSIWFVPMVNPDGVTLVQKGAFSAKKPNQVLKLNGGKTDFKAWKANIRGVDLNRQYPADWGTIKNAAPRPGPLNYKGVAPLTEPETRALYNFTKSHNFLTAVAYHSSGEVLYWDFKTSGSLKTLSRKIADQISAKTGYRLVFSGLNPSGGGYTDWFLDDIKRPGFTPEISPHVGPKPVPLSNFDKIWRQNDTIGLMLAQEAANR